MFVDLGLKVLDGDDCELAVVGCITTLYHELRLAISSMTCEVERIVDCHKYSYRISQFHPGGVYCHVRRLRQEIRGGRSEYKKG